MAAWICLFGFILSGPVGLALVTWLGPQPEWTSAIVFAEHCMDHPGCPMGDDHDGPWPLPFLECIDDPDPGNDPEAIR